MYNNKFGMFELPGFSEDFPVYVQEMGRNPIVWTRIIDNHDAIHA